MQRFHNNEESSKAGPVWYAALLEIKENNLHNREAIVALFLVHKSRSDCNTEFTSLNKRL